MANGIVSTVVEYTPSQLEATAAPTPAVTISARGTTSGNSLDYPVGLAFDASGDLWVASSQGGIVVEYTPGQLAASGAPTPAGILGGGNNGLEDPGGLAIAQAPMVTSVSPAAGNGGTTVTINGAGFDYGSTVDFGNTLSASVTYVSPYELRAVAPPGLGAADVTVSTFAGTSVTTAADRFSYKQGSDQFSDTRGYWLVGSDGGVFSFPAAQFYGSTGSLVLQRPVVGIVPTKDHKGYWLDATDGGVFSFGDAADLFYGSLPGLGFHPAGSDLPHSLNAPVVGMVPSIDDGGYFLVTSDGGVFAFGDAHFSGSCPGLIGGCAAAAVAVMPDASGNGYWVVTKTGNVYGFGDAPYLGAPGQGTVTSGVATPDGKGYWILLSNGEVFNYGDAAPLGAPSAEQLQRARRRCCHIRNLRRWWLLGLVGPRCGLRLRRRPLPGRHDGNSSQRVHYRRHWLLTHQQLSAPQELFGLSSTDGTAASDAATKNGDRGDGTPVQMPAPKCLRRMQLLQASGTTS